MRAIRTIIFFTLFGLLSCNDNAQQEVLDIGAYIFNNNLNATESTEGVYLIVKRVGGEIKPTENSKVEISYRGYYLDNQTFDETPSGQTKIISLNTALSGLGFGLKYFGIGGSGTIIIPSKIGYGSNPPRGIRKDAVLVYDIIVHGIK